MRGNAALHPADMAPPRAESKLQKKFSAILFHAHQKTGRDPCRTGAKKRRLHCSRLLLSAVKMPDDTQSLIPAPSAPLQVFPCPGGRREVRVTNGFCHSFARSSIGRQPEFSRSSIRLLRQTVLAHERKQALQVIEWVILGHFKGLATCK